MEFVSASRLIATVWYLESASRILAISGLCEKWQLQNFTIFERWSLLIVILSKEILLVIPLHMCGIPHSGYESPVQLIQHI